jgi:hypothetical protein
MAKGSAAILLSGREVKYVGGRAWNNAFPNGARSVSTPLPEGTDLGQGYVPEATERGVPGTGNPWQGG